jgi:ATP-dependent RNA helicase RhlE
LKSFAELDLIEPLQRAIAAENYETPTPIQAQAIPPLLEGRDVLGCAQTGTGKTAAFSLPVLQHMARTERRGGKRSIRALVLTPTRELAAQIDESMAVYGKYLDMRHMVIFGGVNENPQIKTLRRGIDVLVATPGRLLDLHGRGFIDLSQVEFFVLDEADRMLDMGFVHDVRRVIAQLPQERQNLLFSATMPPSIVKLAASFLHDPVQVEVTPNATTVELIDQQVMFVSRPDKRRLLADLILDQNVERAIVFTRTKHGANRLAKQLDRSRIQASAIHGNKSQGARTRALDAFRSGDVPILIATDIASRGIDVDDVSHVFNYDLPNIPESYVHRIGRTARAGKGGTAISFCDETEGAYLRDIEKLIGMSIPVVEDHPYHLPAAVPPLRPSAKRKPSPSSSRGPRRSGGGRSRPSGDAAPSRRPPRRRTKPRSPDAAKPLAPKKPTTRSSAPTGDARPTDSRPPRRRRRRGKPPASKS